MTSPAETADRIAQVALKVRQLEETLYLAKQELRELERERDEQLSTCQNKSDPEPDNVTKTQDYDTRLLLPLADYRRYGRQLILPQVGVHGQRRLKNASVLIVGAGGLGCPAAAYLAGAGVGRIGIVDGDIVELSNLHRQILHSSKKLGRFKSDSIREFLTDLNPDVDCIAFRENLRPDNALAIVTQFDIVLDCTDMPASRYLVSDACVQSGVPLIFGSALRTEGQLMVLNYPPRKPGSQDGGPCYRCIWPSPPPPEAVSSCGESGIMGPVVGLIGVMMALEALKILIKGTDDSGRRTLSPAATSTMASSQQPSLLLFSAFGSRQFLPMKMRGRQVDCKACSTNAPNGRDSVLCQSTDYQQMCGRRVPICLLDLSQRRSPVQIAQELDEKDASKRPILLDIRERPDWAVFHLAQSINIPWTALSQYSTSAEVATEIEAQSLIHDDKRSIHVLCRQGNDSQLAVARMKSLGLDLEGQRYIGDVEGGWAKWRKTVPGAWPEY